MFSALKNALCKSFLYVLLAPTAIGFLGAASNQLVLIANHDTFPVLVNGTQLAHFQRDDLKGTLMIDDVHCIMTSKTHLNALADIFDFHDGIESIGDMLMGLGEWLGGFCVFLWGGLLIHKVHTGAV
jgi:hypothetical protein